MARYSPIGPLKVLTQLQNARKLGNYLLILCHDVMKHPDGYAALLSGDLSLGEHEASQREFIILDNSVIELGEAMHAQKLLEVAELIRPDCIVLPDILGDTGATIEAARNASELKDSPFGLMKVPQGETTEDLVTCIRWLYENMNREGHDDIWGIPRWISNKFGSRQSIVQYINQLCESPRIHLLGMSKHLEDDLRCCSFPNVMGIDSANPLVAGSRHAKMRIGDAHHYSRDAYWDWDREFTSAMWDNVNYVRERIASGA